LSLELIDAAGASMYDFSLRGQQKDFAINSTGDAAGQDVMGFGFNPDATYLFVGKISGNGAGTNRLSASLFAGGSMVGNFTDPSFPWMASIEGGVDFNPVISGL